MYYTDEAIKLDIRLLLARALRSGKQDKYCLGIGRQTGHEISPGVRDSPDRVATVSITVHWPANAAEVVSGSLFVAFIGSDNRPASQVLFFSGTPAKVGGWLWRVGCPDTRQKRQSLYLAPDGERFVSHQVAGLKYRRANTAAARALRRGQKLMLKLKTFHWGPGIGKPEGMSDRKFCQLEYKLTKEHIKYMCALHGTVAPDFYDDEPAKPRPDKAIQSQSILYRDKSGTLKMRSQFKKKYGLPKGAAS